MAKRKQELNTAIRITFKNGQTSEFSSIEEASESTGLSVAALKIRCNKNTTPKDGISAEWIDTYTKRYYMAKKNKSKGSGFEYQVIKELTELGFNGLKTSRGESKALDNAKVDVADTENVLSCYIQCKATANTPNIEKISNECPLKDKPLVVMWKKQNAESREHEYVLMPKDYFYYLLSKEL